MASSETPYRFESADGYSVVVLDSALNEAQWADFEKVGNDIIGRLGMIKSPAILVDLTPLNYMGSAMVALIVRIWKSVKEHGGRMVVVNKHEMVYEVLKLASLNNIWTIVESRDEAVAELGVRGRSRGRSAGGAGEGNVALLALGVAGAIGAGVGMYLFLSPPAMVSVKVAQLVLFGSAMLGLITGTITAAREVGSRQIIGIAVIVISVVSVLVGILNSSESSSATPPAAGAPATK